MFDEFMKDLFSSKNWSFWMKAVSNQLCSMRHVDFYVSSGNSVRDPIRAFFPFPGWRSSKFFIKIWIFPLTFKAILLIFLVMFIQKHSFFNERYQPSAKGLKNKN
jgi:hypothetical protein